jgi:hypothetical protein
MLQKESDLLKEIATTLKEIKALESESFKDMYRELREIKVRLIEMGR